MIKRSLLVSSLLASSAYADCTIKCITRNPFSGKCVVKTKVCDIGAPSDWWEQGGKGVVNLKDGITATWHDIYGVLPEKVRVVLNNRVFTIIGAYYGGLQGAALGAGIDELLQKTGVRLEKAKNYTQGAPDWKVIIIEDAVALTTMKHDEIVLQGQATKQYLTAQLDPHYDNFLECVTAAPDYNSGWACYNALEDQLTAIVRQAREQG